MNISRALWILMAVATACGTNSSGTLLDGATGATPTPPVTMIQTNDAASNAGGNGGSTRPDGATTGTTSDATADHPSDTSLNTDLQTQADVSAQGNRDAPSSDTPPDARSNDRVVSLFPSPYPYCRDIGVATCDPTVLTPPPGHSLYYRGPDGQWYLCVVCPFVKNFCWMDSAAGCKSIMFCTPGGGCPGMGIDKPPLP